MISSPGRNSRPAVRENVKFERGHVRAEGDLARLAAEKAGGVCLRTLEDLLDAEAGRIAGAEVGAGVTEGGCDRGADLVGDL